MTATGWVTACTSAASGSFHLPGYGRPRHRPAGGREQTTATTCGRTTARTLGVSYKTAMSLRRRTIGTRPVAIFSSNSVKIPLAMERDTERYGRGEKVRASGARSRRGLRTGRRSSAYRVEPRQNDGSAHYLSSSCEMKPFLQDVTSSDRSPLSSSRKKKKKKTTEEKDPPAV